MMRARAGAAALLALAALLLAAPGPALAALAQPVVEAGAISTTDAAGPGDATTGAAATVASPGAVAPTPAPATGEAPDARAEGDSMLTAMVRMVLVLAGILLLAYLILHKGMGSLSAKLAQGRLVRVVDRIGLEPRKSLYVVEIAGRYYLIGTTDHGVSCLATLDAESDRTAFEDALRARRGTPGARSAATPAAAATAAGASAQGGRDG